MKADRELSTCLYDHQANWARWALIYVDESWLLRCELSSSLYDHSAKRTKWVLIYVFATHVNRSENRKIDRFTASHRRVCAQKLSRAFAVTVWMSYISCSVCAKTLLSFCVYEQRLCHVFTVYVIAMHVHWSDKAKNRSIYCITQTCRCAKAESCLRSICVYVVYEFNVWIKRCYCSVCDCAACKSIWKCEKLIDLLHHVYLYVRKSWVVPLQYMCICRIWAATCMLLSFCVCASFNVSMTALLLLRFSTVYELKM